MDVLAQQFMEIQEATLEDSRKFFNLASEIPGFSFDKWNDALRKACKEKIKNKPKPEKLNQKLYMVTFTLDPKKLKEDGTRWVDDPEYVRRAEQLIEDQGKRPGLDIDKFVYVREYHQSGIPHWHALVISHRKKGLTMDRFKHYIERFGSVKIDASKKLKSGVQVSQQDGDIMNYISKFGDPKTVIDL